MLGDFFKNLPWWIKGPAGLGGLAMNHYSFTLPDWAEPYAAILGAALALWVATALVWHGINAWREHQKKPRIRVQPLHIIILGLAIALCGVIWQMRATPKAVSAAEAKLAVEAKPPAPTGDQFTDAIHAYLVKHGNSISRADDGSIHTGGDSTGDREPYIVYWNSNVIGPPPTVQDGFTKSQLRRFPGKMPKLTTQYDREHFRIAVDDLSKIINQQMGELVRLSGTISGSRPVAPPNAPNGTDKPLETLQRINSIFQDVHARIFNRGSGSDRSLFDQYPSYKEELLDILADGWDPIVGDYNVALQQFTGAVMLLRSAERHLDDREMYNMATHNLDGYQDSLAKATGALHLWATSTSQRIDVTIKAI